MIPASSAMDRALAIINLEGVRSAHRAVKMRARRYLREPMLMHGIDARLPFALPRTMIAIGEHHMDAEMRRRRRLFGFGAEIPLMNARAVRLAGRFRQRFDIENVPVALVRELGAVEAAHD